MRDCPLRLLGLFQKRFEGDDALLALAALRFGEAGLGAEVYAESPDELAWHLGFAPPQGIPAAVHLGRGLDLLDEGGRGLLAEMARRFPPERLFALVAHDQPELVARPDDYIEAVKRAAEGIQEGQYLFVEYAAGLDPGAYVRFFERMRDVERVSACLDTGHLGLRVVRDAYARRRPGEDVFSLSPLDQRLGDVVQDVEAAVREALPMLLQVIEELGRLGKPLHLHLHDGHPLLRSPFGGLSDHFGFLGRVPLPFAHKGRRTLEQMYGLAGLGEIVAACLEALGPRGISLTLEMHPSGGRLPLGNAAALFGHWTDTTNAELTNHWLALLEGNHQLLLDTCRRRAAEQSLPEAYVCPRPCRR